MENYLTIPEAVPDRLPEVVPVREPAAPPLNVTGPLNDPPLKVPEPFLMPAVQVLFEVFHLVNWKSAVILSPLLMAITLSALVILSAPEIHD